MVLVNSSDSSDLHGDIRQLEGSPVFLPGLFLPGISTSWYEYQVDTYK